MTRRELARLLACGPLAYAAVSPGTLTDVPGVRVGHFTETRRPTGCTVMLFDQGAVAGVDVRGAAPGTRETDLLNPINTVQTVNAIVLSGGSAYGLDAASGVMRYLEEKGIGFRVSSGVVSIVPAAVLFDLSVGNGKIRPDAAAGYKACEAATSGPVAEGNVGAGTGATVGKLFGMNAAMKSGLGSISIKIGDTGLVVAALVAVNGVGDVRDPHSGRILAGARTQDGKSFLDTTARMREGFSVTAPLGGNTNLGVVVTNATLDKAQATKIAQMAQDGLARTVNPVHTPYDGDTIFAVGTGKSSAKVNIGTIGALAAEAISDAVVRAVKSAKGLPNLPAYQDMRGA